MGNADRARKLAERIAEQVRRGAGKGLDAARTFLASRVKEALSVPAPRRRVKVPGKDVRYVATSPAARGAPPRKLSGRLRSSVASARVSPTRAVVGTNVVYARFLEKGGHPFLEPAAQQWRAELTRIVGGQVKLALGSA